MALTLGEKLRQAREARGITISEVAEQTRISSLYLEGIEADDYRALPGGIFNKGFVKSYAKYVGVDEQEALQDYTRLMANQDNPAETETKTYRPEVLTDDRSNSSTLLTIIFAIIILGLISWGAYAFANYYGDNGLVSSTPTPSPANNSNAPNSNGNPSPANNQAPVAAPGQIKVQLKALSETTSVTYKLDGKGQSQNITPDTPLEADVQESLLITYSKYQTGNVRMTINGQEIKLPSDPENPSRQAIEFTISKENVGEILQKGEIVFNDSQKSESASTGEKVQ